MQSNEAVPRHAIFSTAFLGIAYLVIFVLLDLISYVEPSAPFAATPWNPRAGVSISLILLLGTRMVPFVVIAPIAELAVRPFPLP
jgi:hypothetical protein